MNDCEQKKSPLTDSLSQCESLTVISRKENLIPVMEFAQRCAEAAGCITKRMRYLLVVCDEIFSNIVKYAYPTTEGEISVHFCAEKDSPTFTIRFIDGGIPFDPLAEEEPDITLALDERPVGKLGLKVVRDLSESVSYAYRDGCNVFSVEMAKR